MVTARSERPRFFEGQYIGAADLAATVDYARELGREAALGGQSWGICIGLDLVEVANASGSFDYFVLPGLAFDGYGRPVTILSPAPVPASLFANLPSGNQNVWLRYDETQNRGLRPGWESCDAGDAYARVDESFKIEVGAMAAVKDRQSGIDIAGSHVEDARLALYSIDADAPLVCDASIPHQTFPADSARWLIPLGVASWTAGSPGALGERSADAKKLSRTLRRYVGQVAESLYAADGVLRLRDRMTDRDETKTPDEQCSATSITTDDLSNAVNPKDRTKTLDRLVGNELVWVEGNMRVTGDARLWGTRLELRESDGSDGGNPLYLDRAPALNAAGGADLEIGLGAAADGKTRLVAGVAAAGAALTSKLQLWNDGRLAVGTTIPADVKSHTILATTEGDTSSAIASAINKVAKLQFATGPTLVESAHLGFDDNVKKLRFGAGTDLAKFLYVTTTGKVGIQTDSPEKLDGDANDLVVASEANSGLTLLGDPAYSGRINFADDATDPARRHAGSIVYEYALNRLGFWTNSAFRVGIDSAGNLGIGTPVPAARLEIDSIADARALLLDANQIQAENGGAASQLSLQRNGGGTLFGASLAATDQVMIGGNGRIGVGTAAPLTSVHVADSAAEVRIETTGGNTAKLSFADSGIARASLEMDPGSKRSLLGNGGTVSMVAQADRIGINIGNSAPVTNLHVRGAIDGSADLIESHVAFIENSAGGSADVLALRVGVANPNDGNNFITFFGTAGPVGRIEGNGASGVSFLSGGADFAEFMAREEAEPIGPGRIVGLRAGRISLATDAAEQLMVTTDRAVVVGNMPAGSQEGWERVALIGQVPVLVEGAVKAGDYILPSGCSDGVGRACSPDRLRSADAVRVVGRAWEDKVEPARGRVLTAIGIAGANQAMARLLHDQSRTIQLLQDQIQALAARLEG